MIKQEEVYKIGRLGKPHGVHGEIQLQFNDDVFDTADADYLVLEVEGILVPFFIEEYRFRSDEIALMKFEDIDTEEKARQLTGCSVFFPRHIVDESSENLSWAQIVGYTLLDNNSGKVVGKICGVDDSTVNTLFEVEDTAGGELLIPANDKLITAKKKKKKTITLVIPDGLLEL